jgi:hypothetical protein
VLIDAINKRAVEIGEKGGLRQLHDPAFSGSLATEDPGRAKTKGRDTSSEIEFAQDEPDAGKGYDDQAATSDLGGNVMEWFTRKTSIAGIQIPNWMVVLGAVIVICLIYTFMQETQVAH